MSNRWLRIDTTWSQSEWLAELEPECRLVWIELLCYTKAHGTDGRVKAGHVALRRVTGVTRDVVAKLVTAAIEHGALEFDDGMWVVTGWQKYQGDPTSAERSRRYRQGRQQDTKTVTSRSVTRVDRDVTPTETETETRNTYTSDFEQVWAIHRKGGKAKAAAAYAKAIRKTTQDVITQSLKAYTDTLRPPQFTGQHLHRWLDEERWEEQAGEPPIDIMAKYERQRRIIYG